MYQVYASVLIITRNKPERLDITLQSLVNQEATEAPFEVVIIDDGSDIDLCVITDKFANHLAIQYIKTVHQGIAVARNIGIHAAKGEVIILTDDDVIVNSTFVRAHISEHRKEESLVVVGDRYNVYCSNLMRDSVKSSLVRALHGDMEGLLKQIRRDFYGKQTLRLFDSEYQKNDQARWICFVARNVSARKNDLIEVGGFDEGFIGWGIEDIELGYRLALHGNRYKYRSDAIVYHLEHTVGNDRVRDINKNFEYFIQKHPTIAPVIYKEFTFGEISLEGFCLSLENGFRTEVEESKRTYYKMIR
ncbi:MULTISPECIES: glycosyltransferase [Photorhabdus]|uniref:Glycosyltransferase n=1 Tax=Photorhabdus kayaii TaxID=230088 RepID=A0ABX0B124_9GAMM|nr:MULTISPECIES: glycosyltransferase [Photorhabdus]MCC8376443.1 glycosyltransferase [Photorhabdus bodei]MCT8351230.1 glycosyltransferase [Photorhabdus kayaii]MDB6368004.1 glycosyltransferase [Photorhabdus bodei]NDL13063.1 glycosyltransferase [Photorhabdus kayaii]NDL26791.1 glycosyltransferase [Photorhabdus kayaii]